VRRTHRHCQRVDASEFHIAARALGLREHGLRGRHARFPAAHVAQFRLHGESRRECDRDRFLCFTHIALKWIRRAVEH
jgi:hypothetical protein